MDTKGFIALTLLVSIALSFQPALAQEPLFDFPVVKSFDCEELEQEGKLDGLLSEGQFGLLDGIEQFAADQDDYPESSCKKQTGLLGDSGIRRCKQDCSWPNKCFKTFFGYRWFGDFYVTSTKCECGIPADWPEAPNANRLNGATGGSGN